MDDTEVSINDPLRVDDTHEVGAITNVSLVVRTEENSQGIYVVCVLEDIVSDIGFLYFIYDLISLRHWLVNNIFGQVRSFGGNTTFIEAWRHVVSSYKDNLLLPDEDDTMFLVEWLRDIIDTAVEGGLG